MMPPEYNPSESINTYINKAETYIMQMQQDKYSAILKFINEWLKTNLKSLMEFKNIREGSLIKDIAHNNEIMTKYIPIFNSTFSIELNVNEDIDYELVDDKYIITLLKHVIQLLDLDYKLTKKTKNNNKYYTIKKN